MDLGSYQKATMTDLHLVGGAQLKWPQVVLAGVNRRCPGKNQALPKGPNQPTNWGHVPYPITTLMERKAL